VGSTIALAQTPYYKRLVQLVSTIFGTSTKVASYFASLFVVLNSSLKELHNSSSSGVTTTAPTPPCFFMDEQST
jgi:hypothetical protein